MPNCLQTNILIGILFVSKNMLSCKFNENQPIELNFLI